MRLDVATHFRYSRPFLDLSKCTKTVLQLLLAQKPCAVSSSNKACHFSSPFRLVALMAGSHNISVRVVKSVGLRNQVIEFASLESQSAKAIETAITFAFKDGNSAAGIVKEIQQLDIYRF